MIRLKQIKITSLLTISLATVLILLSIFLTCIFIDSITHFKNFVEASNKNIIRKQTTYLFQREVELKSKYYSSIFARTETHTELIAKAVEARLNKLAKVPLKKVTKIEMKNAGNGIFYNNFSYSNKCIMFYGKNKAKEDIDKKFSLVSAIIDLDPIIENLYKSSVNSHNWWIALNEGVNIIYPNNFNSLNTNWLSVTKILGEFSDQVSPKKNPEKKAVWSNIFKALNRDYILISVIYPLYDSSDNYIGMTGITLPLNKILVNMLGDEEGFMKDGSSENGDTKIYPSAFSFILNNNEELIAFPSDKSPLFSIKSINGLNYNKMFYKEKLSDSKDPTIRMLAKQMKNDKNGHFNISIKENKYIVAYSFMPLNNWTLVVVIPEYDLFASVRNTQAVIGITERNIIRKVLIITIIVIIISIIICTIFYKKYLLKPILNLRNSAKEIGEGNFDISVKENGTKEIVELAKTFNFLGTELKAYIENLSDEIASRLAIETEVKIAADIQRSALANVTSEFKRDEFDMYAALDSAQDASGDFYDFFYLDENRIVLLVADVSGKGISAAFFMVIAKTLIQSLCFEENSNPATVLQKANNILCRNNKRSMFVTAFLVYYDIKSGKLMYANAGHHDALGIKTDGEFVKFGAKNRVALGVIPDIQYIEESNTVLPGEKILFCTDGVYEAVSPDNEEYGEERLKNLLAENENFNCEKLCSKIVDNVRAFEKNIKFDDITILILKRNKYPQVD
jgi:serine phosphatase RsbU (regulator of sigma subunit)